MKSQSGELQLGKDFISQLETFLPETLQENPIVLTPVGPVSPGNPPHSSPSPSPKSQLSRPGLSRATSLVTTHVLDLPPISEERGSLHDPSISPLALSSSGSDLTNPFVFPSNGFVKDDGGSPPIIMVAPPTDIVVTDVENDEERGGEDERSSRTQLKPGKNRSSSHATEHRKSSLRGPLPSRYKRHSVSSIGHASLSPLSRQSSWNEYKGHSPPIYRRGAGWGPDFNRNPSCPEPRTIFDGSLDEVAKLLHKMAEAIERDMDQN
ncbi:hypothetical protein GBAR_LOCUS25551 [Geodia barretti]|nr:hypothetical protein GBAR_LOCUS25551 [Geodia barretti]